MSNRLVESHNIGGEKISIYNETAREGFKSEYDISLIKPIILFQLGNTYGWFEDRKTDVADMHPNLYASKYNSEQKGWQLASNGNADDLVLPVCVLLRKGEVMSIIRMIFLDKLQLLWDMSSTNSNK